MLLALLPTTVAARDGTWESANEPTPIRYLVCDVLGNKCFVAARFKYLESCESFKVKDAAYCDSVSTPGKIVCDTTKKSDIATSYCTK